MDQVTAVPDIVPGAVADAPAGASGRTVADSTFDSRLRGRLLAVAAIDAVAGGTGCLLAQTAWPPSAPAPVLSAGLDVVFFAFAWVLLLLLLDGYSVRVPTSRLHSAVVVLKAVPGVSLLGFLVFFIEPNYLRRPAVAVSVVAGAILVMAGRWLLSMVMRHPLPLRLLVIGKPDTAAGVVRAVDGGYLKCQLVSCMPIPNLIDSKALSDDLIRRLSEETIDYLVIMGAAMESIAPLVEACASAGARVVTAGALVERFQSRVALDEVTSHWFLDVSNSRALDRPYLVVRRAGDIAVSLLLGIVFLPIMIGAIVMVKLDSPGPVLLRQRRLGQYGREFTMLKLRTMRVDAEANGPTWAQLRDPRVTSAGRVLRATHLDEVPQLINVIRGQMSLIGPRPERPEFYHMLDDTLPHFRSRMLAKPGLSGWAQVKCGYASTLAEATRKLEHDLYYVKNRSLRLDLQIVLLTVFSVLGLRGR